MLHPEGTSCQLQGQGLIPFRQSRRYGYPKELFLLLEKLTRDMDKKIERQKERAEKESEPRVLTPDDQRRLDEILVSLPGHC